MSRPIASLAVLLGIGLHLVGAAAFGAADGLEHTVYSKILEQPRTVTVYLPASYGERPEFSFPVVYLLDGESNADYSVAVSDFLAETAVTPEVITVAVHAGTTRYRDYLPPDPDGPQTAGRADLYLDHLQDEVIPWIESEYRAAPLRLISGHSMGGLLVIHALFLRPGLFEGHLGQSPYVNDAVGRPYLERLQISGPTDPRPKEAGDSRAFYYFNLGEEPQLAQNFERLQSLLEELGSGRRDARGATEVEAGKGHMETRLMGHYKGLERFFAEAWRFSFDGLLEQGASAFLSHVDRVNSAYGYRVLLGESLFQGAIQALFTNQNVSGAQRVSDLYVEYHPRSPVAHFLLANARASTGASNAALDAVQRAIALYDAEPAEELAPLYEAMKRLESSLTPN